MAMERQIQELSAAMKDPARPNLCVACLLCLRTHLEADANHASIRAMRAHNHDVWHAVTRLLMAKRTPADFRAVNEHLLAILTACTSPLWPKIQHSRRRISILKDKDLLLIAVEFFFELLDISLRVVASTKLLQAQRFSKRGLWPQSPQDLLPYGPAESLSSLISWLSFGISSSVAGAFHSLMLACHHELFSHLIAESTRIQLNNVLCERINVAAKYLQYGFPPGVAVVGGRCGLQMLITLASGVLQHLLEISPMKLLDISDGISIYDKYFRGFEKDIITSLETAIPLLDDGYERVRLAGLATTAYESLGVPSSARSKVVEGQAHEIRGDSYGILRHFIVAMRDGRKCARSGCDLSEYKLGRSLHRCSGCGIVTYCSKECQRSDWKLGLTPHKAICAQLKKISPLLDRFPDKVGFSREVRALDITPRDVALLIDNITRGGGSDIKVLPQEARIQHYQLLLALYDERQKSPEAFRNALRNVQGEDSILKMAFSVYAETL